MVSPPGVPVTRGMRRMLWVAAGLVLVQGSILLAAHNDTARYFKLDDRRAGDRGVPRGWLPRRGGARIGGGPPE